MNLGQKIAHQSYQVTKGRELTMMSSHLFAGSGDGLGWELRAFEHVFVQILPYVSASIAPIDVDETRKKDRASTREKSVTSCKTKRRRTACPLSILSWRDSTLAFGFVCLGVSPTFARKILLCA